MALISCKECGTQVSDQAPTCPKCGVPVAAKLASKASAPKKGLGCGGILGLGVLGGIVLIALGGKEAERESKQNLSAPPALSVSAKEILDDYEKNEISADQTYKGKIVQISGVADQIAKDILDKPFVTVGTGKQFELPQVQCFVGSEGESVLASLKPKQKVTIKGKVEGKMMNVLVEDCVVTP